MKLKIGLIILFLGTFIINAHAVTGRDLLIQKEMDYISRRDQIIDQQMALLEKGTSTTYFNDRVHTFSISSQVFYNHYSEPQKTDKVTGVWDGIEAKYIFRPPQGDIFNTPVFNYYALEGLYADGRNELSRNEETIFGPPDYWQKLNIKNIPGYMFEDRILLGRDFIPLPYLRVTPYTGFGIRYKTDQSAGHLDFLSDGINDPPSFLGTPVLGLNRSDLYYYIPTGLTLDLAAIKGYEISLSMEYDYLVKGYERDDYASFDSFSNSALSYLINGYNFTGNQNLRYSLDHGWGARTSLKLLKHFSLVDVYLEPYVRYWHINASKTASGNVGDNDAGPYATPFTNTANKNSTVEAGADLGVQF